jgi:hypothetical protein
MVSAIYQLPNLPSMCPKKTGNSISPGFQESKNGYEQWVRQNMGYFASIVSSAIAHTQECTDGLAKAVGDAEMPLLAALAWPKASPKELRAILDYMTMSFMLEVLT